MQPAHLYVCSFLCLNNDMSKIHPIFCACCMCHCLVLLLVLSMMSCYYIMASSGIANRTYARSKSIRGSSNKIEPHLPKPKHFGVATAATLKKCTNVITYQIHHCLISDMSITQYSFLQSLTIFNKKII